MKTLVLILGILFSFSILAKDHYISITDKDLDFPSNWKLAEVLKIETRDGLENKLILINSEIGKDLIILQTAKKGDTVYIRVNTYGGYTTLAQLYLKSIYNTEARVYLISGEKVMSSGALVFCGAKHKNNKIKKQIIPYTIFMIHSVKLYNKNTKKHENPKDIKNDLFNKYTKKLTNEGCPRLMGKKDWKSFNKGENVYITGYTWIKNMKKGEL